jgi:peroxiredoxin
MLLLALRLFLAAVLAAAAVAKLARPSVFRDTLAGFGLSRWAGAGAMLVPVAELSAAVLLLPARHAWFGALAALCLLALFTAAIAWQLAHGRRPDCNCFGALHAKPIGPSTLVRNGALLGAAALVVFTGRDGAGPSAVAWLGEPLRAAVAGLGLLALAQAVLLVIVLRRYGRVLVRLDGHDGPWKPPAGLPIGSEAPEFALPDLDGDLVTLTSLRERNLPVLLLFSHPACGPCAALLPEVGRWQQERADELVVALVSSGDLGDDRARAAEHELTLVLRDDEDSVAQAYHATGTPMALLVDSDGRVASELFAGADAIGGLVSSIAEPTIQEVLLGV